MSYEIGFIGGGNMSTAIFKGILRKVFSPENLHLAGNFAQEFILRRDTHPASKIWVSGPRKQSLKHWADLGANCTTKNGEVFCNCDIIFLGVKPGLLNVAIDDCLNTLPPNFTSSKNVLFVSMLAGVCIDDLHRNLEVLSKNLCVIRIMPNTPMAVGAGTCHYSPDKNVSPEQCNLLESLLSGCGICEKIPETLMNPLGCLTSCGPAFVYIIIEGLADGAVKQGVPRALALRMAAQTVMGSGKMVLESGKHPGVLKDEVCSPGGTTICGVAALENGKIRATLINALEAATLRNNEIGKK